MKTKLIMLAVSAFALTACKTEFTGQIQAREAIRANVKKGQNYIPAGVSNLKLTIKNRKKAEIEVSVAGKKNNPVIPLNLKGSQLPETSGPIVILGRNSGQPFDIRGNVVTSVERGPLRRGYESCQESVPVRRCYPHPRMPCDTGWDVVQGEREIEYYDELYNSRLNAQLINSRTQTNQGEIGATNTWSERRVVYRSYCRYYGYPRYPY